MLPKQINQLENHTGASLTLVYYAPPQHTQTENKKTLEKSLGLQFINGLLQTGIDYKIS